MDCKNWQFLVFTFLLFAFTGSNAAAEQTTTDPGHEAFDEWLRFFRREITIGISIVQKTNISESCKNRLLSYLHDLASNEPWAVQMWDSMDTLPAGIKQGNLFFWPGSYEECLQVEHDKVKPQYCLTDILLNNTKSIQDFNIYLPNSTISIGICVPSECSTREITLFLHAYLNQNAKVTSVTCQDSSLDHLDSSAIGIIFILTIFVIFVILGTLFEVVPWFRVPVEEEESSAEELVGELAEESVVVPPTQYKQMITAGLVCFSILTTGSTLLSTKRRGEIGCLHGLRFISMAWIILLHTFSTSLVKSWNNVYDLAKLKNSFIAQVILNGNVAVDTFYYMSGLLVAYVFFKKIATTQFNYFLYCFHRYLRLTPVYAIIIGVVAGLLPFLGSGPRWLEVVEMSEFCKENWWLNLLYVSNMFKLDRMCQPHCWFLASDIQLYFIVAPAILYLWSKNKYFGWGMAAAVFVITTLIDALLTYSYDLPATSIIFSVDPMPVQIKYWHMIYMQAYSRAGPYVIGILTGYVLAEMDEPPTFMNKKLALGGWMAAAVCNLSVMFGFYEFIATGTSPSIAERCFYSALSRTAWAAGIAWVVLACKWGYGGFVDSILSWKVFIPLGKLTYCAYILHYNLLMMFYTSRQSTFGYDFWIAIFIYFGILISSYALSVPFCLMFELPILQLEKLVMNNNESILADHHHQMNYAATADTSDTKNGIRGLSNPGYEKEVTNQGEDKRKN